MPSTTTSSTTAKLEKISFRVLKAIIPFSPIHFFDTIEDLSIVAETLEEENREAAHRNALTLSVAAPAANVVESSSSSPPKEVAPSSWKRPLKTVLLIGDSAIGRASFRDLLTNICYDRKLKDFTSEHTSSVVSSGRSDNSNTTARRYQLSGRAGEKLYVLDIPRFTDVRGLDNQAKHRTVIHKTLTTATETIDRIVVLVDGMKPDLPIETEYALSVLLNILPSDFSRRVAFFYTNVPGPLHFTFNDKALHPLFRECQFWIMDNPMPGWMMYLSYLHSSDHSHMEHLEEIHSSVLGVYAKAQDTMRQFFDWLDRRAPLPVEPIDELGELSRIIDTYLDLLIANASHHIDQSHVTVLTARYYSSTNEGP